MSKELQALERIKSHYKDKVCIDVLDDFDIIETSLKENETLKECYKNELNNTAYYNNLALKYKRALEIIKNKKINVGSFIQCSNEPYEEYKESWKFWHKGSFKNLVDELLTQEEYELLKEILK